MNTTALFTFSLVALLLWNVSHGQDITPWLLLVLPIVTALTIRRQRLYQAAEVSENHQSSPGPDIFKFDPQAYNGDIDWDVKDKGVSAFYAACDI